MERPMSDEVPAVAIQGLRKSFGRHEVLCGLDMEVPIGCVFALLGVNGAGKTTTVSILATLLRPDAGTVRVAGLDVVRDAAHVRERITVAGQNATVDPVLTGLENLALIARLRHVHHPNAVAASLIERFGLSDAATKPARTYSGGMRRRLDIALTLIGEPQVVFLDEPTTGLDPAGRHEVWAAIEELATYGRTVILTTQYMEEAARLASIVGVLHRGVITAIGDQQTVLEAAGGAPDLEAAFLALTAGDAAA
jgi:ABC-2 type transport system ATP-binding protein